jgi:hypothetical protein
VLAGLFILGRSWGTEAGNYVPARLQIDRDHGHNAYQSQAIPRKEIDRWRRRKQEHRTGVRCANDGEHRERKAQATRRGNRAGSRRNFSRTKIATTAKLANPVKRKSNVAAIHRPTLLVIVV